jgi:TM2 domain-containing membrane protein YozV
MSRYYVADGMVQRGPYSLADLPGQGLRPDVLVWKEGMDDWRRADQVAEIIFSGLLPAAAPAVPTLPAPSRSYGGYQPIHSTPPYNPANSNRVAAGVCGIFLGGLGIHKFILGMPGTGTLMLLLNLVGGFLTCGLASVVMHAIGLIEGILYLTRSDEDFHQVYVVQKRHWF